MLRAGYNYDETVSTLRYANRAKNIKNKPKINEDPKDAMLREFQDEIARLKAQLEGKGGGGGGRGGGGGYGGGRPDEHRYRTDVQEVEKIVQQVKEVEKVRRSRQAPPPPHTTTHASSTILSTLTPTHPHPLGGGARGDQGG